MTITRTIGAAALLLLLVPAGQALASVPRDLGAFQTQCMAQGGTFGVGQSAGSYQCDYLDGSIQTCEFELVDPVCDVISGPAHNRHEDTKVAGPVVLKPAFDPGFVTPAFP